MTLVSGNHTYPSTDEVMSLYTSIEKAHTDGLLTAASRADLLDAVAHAESHADMDKVKTQLKEMSDRGVE